eukprot:Gb_02917 [translate_table: standard]
MGNEANPVEMAYECAACNMLRRKCEENYVFAPHFPPNDPRKFAIAHSGFGANNIPKMLQDVPTERRGDALHNHALRYFHGCAAQWLGLGNKYMIFNHNWKAQKKRFCPCLCDNSVHWTF